ncbi:MAG TPA: SpoIIE family protein phosphatase [Geodermatophilus sp.]|nr:SpoIIE family protein phosphatase [Geodermatophilus sp.]
MSDGEVAEVRDEEFSAAVDGPPGRDGHPAGVPPAVSRDGRTRELQQLHRALSAAGTVAEVAAAVSEGLRQALGASVVTVCTAGTDGLLYVADVAGYPTERLREFVTLPLSAPLPLTDAARTRRPVWLPDQAATVTAYPPIADSLLPGTEALAAMPLTVADRLIGALGVTFLHTAAFDSTDRTFLLDVAGQVAVALERAELADARREMAEVLQRNLLPGDLPATPGVAVAARYLPAVAGTRAGGDWYDVLTLDDGRVAVTVGDVVGHGAAAAAVMGQLRSALTALLLAGFGPARALQLLDRFAARVPGAAVATAACAVLESGTGRLTYSSAGHPPPLVVDGTGGTYLHAGAGPALGLPAAGRPAAGPADDGLRPEASGQLDPLSTLLLYTDGLVETRGASLDDGLARLGGVAAQRRELPVAELTDAVLAGLLDPSGAADDVAVVALRLLPAPLVLDLPATPAVLARVRRAAGGWAAAAGLQPDVVQDLHLALGEAAGNAAEHAYRDRPAPGLLHVRLSQDADGPVTAVVSDTGSWRPAPADPGDRGRGLQMISALATDVDLTAGPTGTTIRFRLRPPPPAPTPDPAPADGVGSAPEQPATVEVSHADDRTCVVITGDLDQAGVTAVADALRTETARTSAAVDGPPLLVDLRGLGWLSSVGIGLLLQAARDATGQVTFALPPAGPARRALDLTGVTGQLPPAADPA